MNWSSHEFIWLDWVVLIVGLLGVVAAVWYAIWKDNKAQQGEDSSAYLFGKGEPWYVIGMAIGAFGVAVTFGNDSLALVTAASLLVYSASFMFSWGPITWVLIAEIFPNTIRGGAVAIAVAFQWIFNFIVSSSFVPMFNMHLSEGDDFGHWFTYGLYGIICVIAALFVWKLVPETKGKTLEDMTAMWKNRK